MWDANRGTPSIDMRAIDDVLGRATGRRGAKLLRTVLAEHRVASTLTRNELAEAFLAVRITWQQVEFEPAYVAATLLGLLRH